METRGNYVLIGAFTLLGIIAIVAVSVWFARIELDRQFAYYDIRFTSVAGLSAASDVRFSGLPVGQVVDVALSPERDGTITVRVEVDAETPVRTDSIATIEAQGVTGVSYVSIGAGSPEAALVRPDGGEVPEIEAGRSTLQSLAEDAPELVNETLRVVREIGALFGGENEGRLERILVNVEIATEEFADTLESFSDIADTIDTFAAQISRFNETLDTLTSELAVVLATADETLASVGLLADQSTAIVASGTDTLDAFQGALGEVERYVSEDLSATTEDVQETLTTLQGELTTLRADASALMATLGTTGTTATARLDEFEGAIENLNALLANIDTASAMVDAAATRFDTLLVEEAEPFLVETRVAVAEATTMLRSVNATFAEDLPAIFADIRSATGQITETVDSLAEDLATAGASVPQLVETAEVTFTAVTETFERANATLDGIDLAMDTAVETLLIAESAFAGADRVISEDLGGIIAELEATLDSLETAVGTVASDLPEISADLSAASAGAAAAFVSLQSLVDGASPGVREFTQSTLPLFSGLAIEARELIGNLDRLTQQLSRDPARFILDRDVPEFRR